MRHVGFTIAAFALLLATSRSFAQGPSPAPVDRPLPDITTLVSQVEANERKSEAIRKDYIYNETNKFDQRDSLEAIKKTESLDTEVFWLNGVPVQRTLKKDGKPLTEDETRKENDRIDAIVRKAKERRDRADAKGKESDPRGNDELTLARILELGRFSDPRRELIQGRDTIVVDYIGDPKAKTHNYAEGLFRELSGTVWVDEQDRTMVRLEGHFSRDFKIAGGLGANVKEGTWFKIAFVKINDEVWLPAAMEGDGHVRYLLFFKLDGHFQGRMSNYRKFKATSTILRGIAEVDPATPTDPPEGDKPETPK